MAFRRVWTLADGSVMITTPGPGKTIAEASQDALASIPALQTATFQNIDDASGTWAALFPASGRQFRSAWRRAGNNPLTVDMPTARRIKAERIQVDLERRDRQAAGREMAEPGASKTAWSAYRQQLRGVVRDLSNLTTEAALASFTPAWPTEPA